MGKNPNPYGGGNANPGGPGGHRGRIPVGGGGGHKKKGCCSMAEAGRAARRGRWRLAARDVRMTPRVIAGRFA